MDIELGNIRGWAFNNLTLRGGLEGILEESSDIQNTSSEVVGVRDGDNQTEFRC